jgi:thiosulfate/3-mercaptopyruvate sulfurtransferase
MPEWDGRGLVSTEWLAAHLDDPELRLFDATVRLVPKVPGPYQIESGRTAYEEAHIPGAGFLDLIADLSDPEATIPFMMPSAERLAARLGAAGIGPNSRVVLYSWPTPMWATRVWWMLRACGFEEAAVLDGGLGKWRAEGRPLEAGTRRYPETTLTLTARPGAWADRHAVLAAIGDGAVCTINALAPASFSGEAASSYGRKGHITGSVNVPYERLLQPDGSFRPDTELRPLFEAVGALDRPRVICYCGGGISATMDALVLTRLGHRDVAIYDASMWEWANDPSLPMATGA